MTGQGPWPAIDDVDYAGLARAFGCAAERVEDAGAAATSVIPTLAGRHEPFLLEVLVEPDELLESRLHRLESCERYQAPKASASEPSGGMRGTRRRRAVAALRAPPTRAENSAIEIARRHQDDERGTREGRARDRGDQEDRDAGAAGHAVREADRERLRGRSQGMAMPVLARRAWDDVHVALPVVVVEMEVVGAATPAYEEATARHDDDEADQRLHELLDDLRQGCGGGAPAGRTRARSSRVRTPRCAESCAGSRRPARVSATSVETATRWSGSDA